MDESRDSEWDERAAEILEAEIPPVVLAYTAFGEASDVFTDELAELAAFTSEFRVNGLAIPPDRVSALGRLFGGYVQELLISAGVTEEAIQEIANAFIRDNTERIVMMEKLVSLETDVVFPKYNPDDVQGLIEHILENLSWIEAVSQALGRIFADDLSSDLDRYFSGLVAKQTLLHPDDLPNIIDAVNEDENNDDDEGADEETLLAEVGRHVLDIGKIATGALIALVVNGLIQRRFRR